MRTIILALLISGEALASSRAKIDQLPSKSGDHKIYIKMRSALGFIESRNDPSAKNRKTSAIGKYQFMKRWDGWFLKNAGTKWTAAIPRKSASKDERSKMSEEQDRLFDTYYDKIVRKWVSESRKKPGSEKYSDPELVALYHRQGEHYANQFLKNGKDKFAGKYGNRHVTKHLQAMRKAMDFEHYLSNMEGK